MFGKSQPLTGSANNTIDRTRGEQPAPPRADLGADYRLRLEEIVAHAVAQSASDIHLRVESYPVIRVDGDLTPVESFDVLSRNDLEGLLQAILKPREMQILEQEKQLDTAIGVAAIGRVRVNAFYQRGTVALALRIIKTEIPTLEELGLPEVIYKFSRLRSGLVLVTGATGSGKSTTLAALVDEINKRYAKHIITIEDPIEFLFRDKKSIIAQREIGIDADSFDVAMTAALREDPDVILMSDLRDAASMEFAMNAAETGHLVLGTLHSPTTPDAITRIVSTFPPNAQHTVRTKLSQNLKAVVGQRLLPSLDRAGRVLACEVMLVTPRVQELILEPSKIAEISELVNKTNAVDGMFSFDRHIYDLYTQNRISADVAVRYATSRNDINLKLRGFST